MPEQQLPVVQGIAISTPGDWLVFDPEVVRDADALANQLEARIDEVEDLRPHRQELLEIVRQTGSYAEQAGVLFAATHFSTLAGGIPLLANVTVALLERKAAEAETPAEDGPSSDGTPGLGESDVRIAILPAGRAVRIERVTEVPLFADTSLVSLTVQYLLEVPGAPDELLAITYTSPTMPERERLTALFDGMAATFEWTHDPQTEE